MWTLVFFIACLVGIIIYQQYRKIAEKNRIVIYTGAGSVKISVKYAETPEKRISGLTNVQLLDKNSGMLFIFPDEKIREFWMKDTLIPLEIIFIGTKGNINEITIMKPCSSNILNCPVYTSKSPARFAIEVNTGFTVKNRIIEGDILEISGF